MTEEEFLQNKIEALEAERQRLCAMGEFDNAERVRIHKAIVEAIVEEQLRILKSNE
jgi:hypothetical protein